MNQAEIDSDISALDPSKDLDEQGVDSLDMINALLAIQEEFDVEISDDEIASGFWSWNRRSRRPFHVEPSAPGMRAPYSPSGTAGGAWERSATC